MPKILGVNQPVPANPTQTLTYGATTNWDVSVSETANLTLTGNSIMAAPTNLHPSTTYVLKVTQDVVGSRLITWNSEFQWPSAIPPVLSTAASAVDLISLYCHTKPMSSVTFYNPYGMAIDSSGNLYVSDLGNDSIRKITPNNIVTTFASGFNQPSGVVIDSSGNTFVSNYNLNQIYKITASGTSTIFATTNVSGPRGLAIDSSGNLFVASSSNHIILKITPLGVVTTFAGTIGVPGTTDATGTSAKFNGPSGLTIDSSNNLYVSDQTSCLIRKITSSAVVTTISGTGVAGFADGTGTSASFSLPSGLAIDASNSNLYVADSSNYTIRKITLPGIVVTTLAGSHGSIGTVDGTGSAARFNRPNGNPTIDRFGNIYVTDGFPNNTVRKITTAGVVTTFAGTALAGSSGSPINNLFLIGSYLRGIA